DAQANTKALSEHAIECAICKVFSSETLDQVVDEALQLHGGYGFMKDYAVENMYHDSRINRIFEGTNEINADHVQLASLLLNTLLDRKCWEAARIDGELSFR
ncbi:MAG TPA: acyl-CoA dehydrogenase family protein, partial [Candidatus Angelobacter sp.]|nr:acyl-CoA dehydrogenase family protein [Candidatus Angelobacter sp.]